MVPCRMSMGEGDLVSRQCRVRVKMTLCSVVTLALSFWGVVSLLTKALALTKLVLMR